MAKLCERPQDRKMSWFKGREERPRRSQSRVLSGDDGHIFMIESEFSDTLKRCPLPLALCACGKLGGAWGRGESTGTSTQVKEYQHLWECIVTHAH